MRPLCNVRTPFKEKFGVPRQSLLVEEAEGLLSFPKNDFFVEAFRGIETFSHLWLIFEFHLIEEGSFNALVRPPRFDGKKKMGIFATRSPHRPNRLGLSVVKFKNIEILDQEILLRVEGIDLVDGTPIYDIKPYLPYADRVENSFSSDFSLPPKMTQVEWLCEKPQDFYLIEKVIALDPRPSFDKNSDKEFGVSIAGKNIRFKKQNNEFVIVSWTDDMSILGGEI